MFTFNFTGISDCDVIPYHLYCLDQVEYSEGEELLTRPLYTICLSADGGEKWFETVEIKLFTGLFIISMIFFRAIE